MAKVAKQKGEKVGETNKNLAIEYDVDFSTIKAVVANKTWADVETSPTYKYELVASKYDNC